MEAGATGSHLLGSVVFYDAKKQKRGPLNKLTGAGELAINKIVSKDNMRLEKRSSNHGFA